MRVLQLGPYAPPHGGVQANLSAIREALLQRGASCAVVTLTRSQSARTDDPDVFRPQSALQLVKYLLRLQCDIVHLHLGGNLTFRLLGVTLLCTLMPTRKFVLTFHSGGYASSSAGKGARKWTLRGIIFRRVDRIIGVNREIVSMFEKFGVPPERVKLIPPHALKKPSSETEVPQAIKGFLETHNPILLSVGLLENEYNLPMQIDALGQIRKKFGGAGLIMIGSGSQERNLRRIIEDQDHAEHILLCGDTEHDVTIHVIEKCDVMLRTTGYDGDAISVREALHLGTPVIATDNGMRPEGVNLIPTANLTSLCVAIEKQLGEVRPKVSQGNNGNENIDAVLDLYQELLGKE